MNLWILNFLLNNRRLLFPYFDVLRVCTEMLYFNSFYFNMEAALKISVISIRRLSTYIMASWKFLKIEKCFIIIIKYKLARSFVNFFLIFNPFTDCKVSFKKLEIYKSVNVNISFPFCPRNASILLILFNSLIAFLQILDSCFSKFNTLSHQCLKV